MSICQPITPRNQLSEEHQSLTGATPACPVQVLKEKGVKANADAMYHQNKKEVDDLKARRDIVEKDKHQIQQVRWCGGETRIATAPWARVGRRCHFETTIKPNRLFVI